MPVTSPHRGVACWRHPETLAKCVAIHYSADPAKRDPLWKEQESRLYLGGTAGVDWQLEYELNVRANPGEFTYHSWGEWNLVEPYEVPLDWEWWLSVDFGARVQTAVLFWAQDQKTEDIVLFNEVYEAKMPTPLIKLQVYERLSEERMIPLEELHPDEFLVDNVGDPSNVQEMMDWAHEPLPIYVRGDAPGGKWSLRDKVIGEKRVNRLLAPVIRCCGERQFVQKYSGGGFAKEAPCRKCSGIRVAKPQLTVMKGKCPNLVRTWKNAKRKPPTQADFQPGETETRREIHAWDALRYGVMRLPLDVTKAPAPLDILSIPVHKLSLEQRVQRLYAEHARQQKLAEAEENAGDDGYLMTTDEDREPEEEQDPTMEPVFDA